MAGRKIAGAAHLQAREVKLIQGSIQSLPKEADRALLAGENVGESRDLGGVRDF